MPLLATILLGLALGVGFAWAAMEDLRQHQGVRQSEASWIVLSFCLLVYGPSSAYLVSYHGDWSLSYWLSAANLPPALSTTLVACAAASPFAGLLVGSPWAQTRRPIVLMYLCAGLSLLCVVGLLASLPRLLVDATTVEFRNDFGTRSIAGSALGYALLWMVAIVGAAALWTAATLRHIHHQNDLLLPSGSVRGDQATKGLVSERRRK